MRRKDPRLLGFIVGFGSVFLVGLILIVGWDLLNTSATATLVPSARADARAISEQATVVPPTATDLPTATIPPQPTETAVAPAPTTRAADLQYTVREGDTLFDIALAYDLSIETLQSANALNGETIVPGQVLTIPPGPLPTLTPYMEGDTVVHTVSSGETLIGIAKTYSVTVEQLQAANDLESEVIQPGWKLEVPVPAEGTPESTRPLQLETAAGQNWQPSILEGDLVAAYPLTLENARFTMHYQPDTPAAQDADQVRELIEAALNHVEDKLQVTLEGQWDAYVAGSLFGPDNLALRGRSFSSQRSNFYLYDDTGTPDERRYLITHELTHLVAWNTIGKPSSVMLHEGLAVYTGAEAMEAAEFISLSDFCAAYYKADQLPQLSGSRSYGGHIRDLDLYFAAGCFVGHMIETYGLQDFKQLFVSGDYRGIYGRPLSQLEKDWHKTLEPLGDTLSFKPEDLITSVETVNTAYTCLFEDFQGTSSQLQAYRQLDRARIAMLQGRFEAVQIYLDQFENLLQGE